jgi:hypothetical protein
MIARNHGSVLQVLLKGRLPPGSFVGVMLALIPSAQDFWYMSDLETLRGALSSRWEHIHITTQHHSVRHCGSIGELGIRFSLHGILTEILSAFVLLTRRLSAVPSSTRQPGERLVAIVYPAT